MRDLHVLITGGRDGVGSWAMGVGNLRFEGLIGFGLLSLGCFVIGVFLMYGNHGFRFFIRGFAKFGRQTFLKHSRAVRQSARRKKQKAKWWACRPCSLCGLRACGFEE